MARHVHKETGQRNLCLAGGVALNCVGNGKLLREGPFERHLDSAGGRRCRRRRRRRAGGVAPLSRRSRATRRRAGAGLCRRHEGRVSRPALLPTRFARSSTSAGFRTGGSRLRAAARQESPRLLARSRSSAGSRGGWSSGRARSADAASSAIPRSPRMQSVLNLKIKYRESFRPFAPAVLREHVGEYFELDGDSPYMLLVAQVREDKCVQMTEAQRALFGIEKLQRAALGHPGGDARRLLGARADRHEAENPAFYRAAPGLHRRPAVRCSSTRASTCAASRSSCRPRTRSAASCGPRWTISCSRTASSTSAISRRSSRTRMEGRVHA